MADQRAHLTAHSAADPQCQHCMSITPLGSSTPELMCHRGVGCPLAAPPDGVHAPTEFVNGVAIRPAFVALSSRMARAMLTGAGLPGDRVLGCSLEIGSPGECHLQVKYHLPPEAVSRVLAGLGTIDPEAPL